MKQTMSLHDLSDVLNTLQDGVSTLAAMIYTDLTANNVLEADEAARSLRKLSGIMRSEQQHSAIIGEGLARKFEDMAVLFETAKGSDH